MTTVICANGVLVSDAKASLSYVGRHKLLTKDKDGNDVEAPKTFYYKQKLWLDRSHHWDVWPDFAVGIAGDVETLLKVSNMLRHAVDIVRGGLDGKGESKDPLTFGAAQDVLWLVKSAWGKVFSNNTLIMMHRDGNCAELKIGYPTSDMIVHDKKYFTHDGVYAAGSGGRHHKIALPYVDITDPMAAVHIATICAYIDKNYSGGDLHYCMAGPAPIMDEASKAALDDKKDEEDKDSKDDMESSFMAIFGKAITLGEARKKYKAGLNDPMSVHTFTVDQQKAFLEKIDYGFEYIDTAPEPEPEPEAPKEPEKKSTLQRKSTKTAK